jgi:hypothetical protein
MSITLNLKKKNVNLKYIFIKNCIKLKVNRFFANKIENIICSFFYLLPWHFLHDAKVRNFMNFRSIQVIFHEFDSCHTHNACEGPTVLKVFIMFGGISL